MMSPATTWTEKPGPRELRLLVFRRARGSQPPPPPPHRADTSPPPETPPSPSPSASSQMQNYYRYGEFDNCFGKWGDLVDCLTLKTKRAAEVEEILIAREKAKPHIWTFRTVDEASEHWWRMYKHAALMSTPLPRTAQPPPKSAES
nr:unnamed protein product [Digitaria exilis]